MHINERVQKDFKSVYENFPKERAEEAKISYREVLRRKKKGLVWQTINFILISQHTFELFLVVNEIELI